MDGPPACGQDTLDVSKGVTQPAEGSLQARSADVRRTSAPHFFVLCSRTTGTESTAYPLREPTIIPLRMRSTVYSGVVVVDKGAARDLPFFFFCVDFLLR